MTHVLTICLLCVTVCMQDCHQQPAKAHWSSTSLRATSSEHDDASNEATGCDEHQLGCIVTSGDLCASAALAFL
jgi:hypothetical protein